MNKGPVTLHDSLILWDRNRARMCREKKSNSGLLRVGNSGPISQTVCDFITSIYCVLRQLSCWRSKIVTWSDHYMSFKSTWYFYTIGIVVSQIFCKIGPMHFLIKHDICWYENNEYNHKKTIANITYVSYYGRYCVFHDFDNLYEMAVAFECIIKKKHNSYSASNWAHTIS